jgi:hypothetical protein
MSYMFYFKPHIQMSLLGGESYLSYMSYKSHISNMPLFKPLLNCDLPMPRNKYGERVRGTFFLMPRREGNTKRRLIGNTFTLSLFPSLSFFPSPSFPQSYSLSLSLFPLILLSFTLCLSLSLSLSLLYPFSQKIHAREEN